MTRSEIAVFAVLWTAALATIPVTLDALLGR